MTKLWGGRFEGEPAPELMAFTESLSFDVVLVREDCAVLAAHVRGLARAGLLGDNDAIRLCDALDEIADQIASGDFTFGPGDEDIHTAVERALIERLPDLAPRARAGLSRNDRVASALRLWLLREGKDVLEALAGLIDTLVRRARGTTDVILPGYTHLQRAQPVRLAHHLLAHAFALSRDAQRLFAALATADASPLGAGALAGSTLGLDAVAAAEDLGFSDVLPNSIDAVSARDFVAEFLAAAAICATHCSRIGEEIVLWTSAEFAFADLPDTHATGSSLMPQKKNPDIAELARGKTGRLIGNLAGFLATLKGLPLAYNRDLQEDKEPLFDTVAQLRRMLVALSGAMDGMRFDADAMGRAAASGSVLATDLAEYLVRKGVAFREAHEAVGRVVQRALAQERDLTELSIEELRDLHASFGTDVREVLNARTSVERRVMPGPSRASIDDQLRRIDAELDGIRKALA